MSKILFAGVAAASLFAAAPVFAQGAPAWLLQQSQTSGYQVYAENHAPNGVEAAQAEQLQQPQSYAQNPVPGRYTSYVQR